MKYHLSIRCQTPIDRSSVIKSEWPSWPASPWSWALNNVSMHVTDVTVESYHTSLLCPLNLSDSLPVASVVKSVRLMLSRDLNASLSLQSQQPRLIFQITDVVADIVLTAARTHQHHLSGMTSCSTALLNILTRLNRRQPPASTHGHGSWPGDSSDSRSLNDFLEFIFRTARGRRLDNVRIVTGARRIMMGVEIEMFRSSSLAWQFPDRGPWYTEVLGYRTVNN